jgi:hypothetical protein
MDLNWEDGRFTESYQGQASQGTRFLPFTESTPFVDGMNCNSLSYMLHWIPPLPHLCLYQIIIGRFDDYAELCPGRYDGSVKKHDYLRNVPLNIPQ